VTAAAAQELLTGRPGADVRLLARDATGQHWIAHRCWLEAGSLVHSHPTDPRRGAVTAPRDGYYVGAP